MTGPEHLIAGKRVLAGLPGLPGDTDMGDIQAAATFALAHLMAAQVCATVDTVLADRVSWAEASDA